MRSWERACSLRRRALSAARAFLAQRNEFSANQKTPGTEDQEKQAETEQGVFSACSAEPSPS